MTNRRIQSALTTAVLAATFSLTLFSPTYAATLTQTGTPGNNGTNATTDAGNGTNATPGQDLTIPITSSDPSNSITITGGAGGNGGNGAPTTSAPQAGNAGAGANGGNATLSATLKLPANANMTVIGGNGGQAGLPGPAGPTSIAGNPSIPGNGGNATISNNLGGSIPNLANMIGTAIGGTSPGGKGGNAQSTVGGFGTGSIQSIAIAGTGATDGQAVATSDGTLFTGTIISIATDPTVGSSNPGIIGGDSSGTGSGTISCIGNIGNVDGIGRPIAHFSLTAIAPLTSSDSSTRILGEYSQPTLNLDHNHSRTQSEFVAAPSVTQSATALASRPHINADFNPATSEDLGLGTLAVSSNSNNTATTSYHSDASILIDPAHLQQPAQDILVGLLVPYTADAGGLSSLHFQIFSPQSTTVYEDMTFTNFAAASTFFTDNPIDVGPINSLHTTANGMIDLGISIDAVTTNAGNYFAFDFMLANTTPTPEPASLSLLAAALPILFRRRRHSPPSNRHSTIQI